MLPPAGQGRICRTYEFIHLSVLYCRTGRDFITVFWRGNFKVGDLERDDSRGLCAGCVHAQKVPHPRGGGAYLMCGLSERDDAYDRYPRLPVTTCPGFEAKTETSPQLP